MIAESVRKLHAEVERRLGHSVRVEDPEILEGRGAFCDGATHYEEMPEEGLIVVHVRKGEGAWESLWLEEDGRLTRWGEVRTGLRRLGGEYGER
jgi:hypothetical protein